MTSDKITNSIHQVKPSSSQQFREQIRPPTPEKSSQQESHNAINIDSILARQSNMNVIRIPSSLEIYVYEEDDVTIKVKKKQNGRRKSRTKLPSSYKHKIHVDDKKSQSHKHPTKSNKEVKTLKSETRKRSTATAPIIKNDVPSRSKEAVDAVSDERSTATGPIIKNDVPSGSKEAVDAISDESSVFTTKPRCNEEANVQRQTTQKVAEAESRQETIISRNASGIRAQHRLSFTPAKPSNNLNEEHVRHRVSGFLYDVDDDYDSIQAINKMLSACSEHVKPWMNTRVALCMEASRFELPIDITTLENMSAQDYLRRHVIVSPKRKYLYRKMFVKHKDERDHILLKELGASLDDVLIDMTISDDKLAQVKTMLDITAETIIDLELFSGIAAFLERIIYSECLTEEIKMSQRHLVERADFCGLMWMCNGVRVNTGIKAILDCLS